MGGRFHHAPRRAREAKSAVLATESDQVLVSALVALHSQESMFEPPATQIRLELITHESGQCAIVLTEMGEERLCMLLDDPLEQRCFLAVTSVAALR